MSYQMTLEKAGAKIIAFEEFGSYQGDWYAKVEYNGEIGWITGCYGSCSGCDSFEAEFGYVEDKCEAHQTDWKGEQSKDCPECQKAAAALDERYAAFGRTYLDTILPQEKQEEILRERIAAENWDADELREILDFVVKNREGGAA